MASDGPAEAGAALVVAPVACYPDRRRAGVAGVAQSAANGDQPPAVGLP